MFIKRDVGFYIDVIEGRRTLWRREITYAYRRLYDEPSVHTAFEKMAELGGEKATNYFFKCLDNEDLTKKTLALNGLGTIGSERHEKRISEFLRSENPDLSFAALSALCCIFERDSLSKSYKRKFEEYVLSILWNTEAANEDLITCAVALKRTGHPDIEATLQYLKKHRPEIIPDIAGLI